MWERLVGMTKKAFKATLGNRILDKEEAETIFVEVEAILNTRPITHIYEGPDTIVLRPKDLIGCTRGITAPFFDEEDPDQSFSLEKETKRDDLLKYWKQITKLLKQFWKIWYTEYIHSLRDRAQRDIKQGRTANIDPKVGEVVLIGENTPRGLWKLGKIEDLPAKHPQRNRFAHLKTMDGKTTSGRVSGQARERHCPTLQNSELYRSRPKGHGRRSS